MTTESKNSVDDEEAATIGDQDDLCDADDMLYSDNIYNDSKFSNQSLSSDLYQILSLNVVEEKMQKIIDEVADILKISFDESLLLLQYFKQNQNILIREYMEKCKLIRIKAGLEVEETSYKNKSKYQKSSVDSAKSADISSIECPQCYDLVDLNQTFSLKCCHLSCKDCWKDYLTEHIKLGRYSAFPLHCNYYQCNMIIPLSIYDSFISVDFRKRLRQYILNAFVDASPTLAQCPGLGCKSICEYTLGGIVEINCTSCSMIYCFKCLQSSHRPASCEMASKQLLKSSSEAENATWILANTKSCPNCKIQIEKNQGCNHMTCRNCQYQFCQMCKGDQKTHGTANGGYYQCNRYAKAAAKGDISTEEKISNQAKNELQRYLHYFQRFDNHDKATKFAKNALESYETKINSMRERKGSRLNDVDFLVKAFETVIECRRLLKWTYCFGYYLESGIEKNLFEKLQEDLEKYTEHLHELTEKPLQELLTINSRSVINNFTRVTEKFRINLTIGIENGLTS